MTQDELRIGLAKTRGWTPGKANVNPDHSVAEGFWFNGRFHLGLDWLPDYFGDLNAIQELVLSLTQEQQEDYRRHLADVIHPGSGFSKTGHACVMSKETYTRWFNATAPERAEALCRLLLKTTTTTNEYP